MSWQAIGRTMGVLLAIVSGSSVAAAAAECPGASTPETAQLLAPDAGREDWFGQAVALDGRWAAIGAHLDDDACPGSNCTSGSVYLYRRDVSGWTFASKLTAPDAMPRQIFGTSLAMSGDVLAVGALGDASGGFRSGAVYVYELDFGDVPRVTKLTAPVGHAHQRFGLALALGQGLLVVGAPGDDSAAPGAGAVYVYERGRGGWSLTAQLLAADPSAKMYFGNSVGVSGRVVAVGAPGWFGYDPPEGLVYLFEEIAGPGEWQQTVRLASPTGMKGNGFGGTLAFAPDRMVVGSPRDVLGEGAVFVVERTEGDWTFTDVLSPPAGNIGSLFGGAVDIDGARVAVGATHDDECGEESGAAFLFTDSGSGWMPGLRLLPSDLRLGDQLGFDVALDGESVLVGAHRHSSAQPHWEEGAAYVFTAPSRAVVSIDIKPGDPTNTVHVAAQGVVPVAVLTTSRADGDPADFDATTVDANNARFGPGGAPIAHRNGHAEDVDLDGDVDLLLHFRSRDIGLECGLDTLTLEASTVGGLSISGTDSVRLVGCDR